MKLRVAASSNPPLKIMVVEDNDDIRLGWLLFLTRHGHNARGVAMAGDLLSECADFSPHIYLVDLNLPDADGLNLVSQLRQTQPNVGIAIATARSQIGDKVLGYDRGADLYFTKPVDPSELMAGLVSLAKRLQPSPQAEHALRLNLNAHVLKGPAAAVDLTPAESVLLAGLVRAAGQPLARWQLAELMGGGADVPAAATTEMRMARLRKKLSAAGAQGPTIRALYNRGYVLSCAVQLS